MGACSVQTRSRGLETREVGFAIRYARFGRFTLDTSLGAKSAGAPPGQPCTSRSFRHDPRMLTPRAWCRPPRWRSLSREEPSSDVPCRLTGTAHRLQPTHRCRTDAHTLRCLRLRGLTRSASAASRWPRKGTPSDDAGRLEGYRDTSQAFAPVRPCQALCLIRTRSPACAPVRSLLHRSPRQLRGFRTRQSRVLRARSLSIGCSCERPGSPRDRRARSEMRPIRSCFPSLIR